MIRIEIEVSIPEHDTALAVAASIAAETAARLASHGVVHRVSVEEADA